MPFIIAEMTDYVDDLGFEGIDAAGFLFCFDVAQHTYTHYVSHLLTSLIFNVIAPVSFLL